MERLMRVREVANLLGVSRYTIYKWIKKGLIEYVVLPSGRIRIPESEVVRFQSKNLGVGVEELDNKNR